MPMVSIIKDALGSEERENYNLDKPKTAYMICPVKHA